MTKTSAFIFLTAISFIINSCKHDVSVGKNDSITSSSQSNLIIKKNGPIGAVYIEVNSNNVLNAGCYTLLNSGQQLFDIAMIFAANINYDVTHHHAVEYNNDNVTKVLQNRNTYIKPLQDKGIK